MNLAESVLIHRRNHRLPDAVVVRLDALAVGAGSQKVRGTQEREGGAGVTLQLGSGSGDLRMCWPSADGNDLEEAARRRSERVEPRLDGLRQRDAGRERLAARVDL